MEGNFYVIDEKPTSNKDVVIGLITQVMWDYFNLDEDLDNISFVKTCNLYSLDKVYEDWMKNIASMDYDLYKFVKKSVKLSYGGSKLFGLSTTEKNMFLNDLKSCLVDSLRK
ncbi:MAG: hypothetical protein ACRCXT_13340 [Paraclostridium sp.]